MVGPTPSSHGQRVEVWCNEGPHYNAQLVCIWQIGWVVLSPRPDVSDLLRSPDLIGKPYTGMTWLSDVCLTFNW